MGSGTESNDTDVLPAFFLKEKELVDQLSNQVWITTFFMFSGRTESPSVYMKTSDS